MHFTQFLSISGFLSIASSMPLATSGLEDLDILVPGPNNTLIHPDDPAAAMRELSAPLKSLTRRDCSITSGQ
jgi:hypothetical protein